jgi:branched-chain amino acid transport system substrate-binding protein
MKMPRKPSRSLLPAALAVLSFLAVPLASGQELVVGQIASQTHVVTTLNAKANYTGLKVYFDSINASGGINGRMLKLVTRDDNLVPAKMVEITKEFIADKNVLALAGYLNTSGLAELAKQDIPGQGGIPLIAPLQGDKNIVGAANFFPFRSGYSDEVVALLKEAVYTQKKKVVVVYWNVSFGPAMMEMAQEWTKKEGLNVVTWIKLDATAPAQPQEKFDAIMKEAVAATVKQSPDAIIMLNSSRYTLEFVKQIKNSPSESAQIYVMSVVPPADLVKAAGAAKARGIVIAQAVPFPFSATLPLVREYQKLMQQYAPNEPLSFSTLEGFAAGKITAEAIKRAGPKPTREKVLKALIAMGEFNLGGVYVNYSPKERLGWGGVDLTVIGPDGKLLR